MTDSPKDLSVHFSSRSNDWQTPPWLFSLLNEEFYFDLDAAASDANHLCPRYYTEQQDALVQEWGKDAKSVWTNPPYGRIIPRFVKHAHEQTLKYPLLTVTMLIPARTDTKWWHNHCAKGEVRFIKGRLKFINPALPSFRADGDFKMSPAPFPSAIVIFGAEAVAGKTSYVEYREPKTVRA
jgi:phage N-6-adenine-methyltransferase